MDDDFEQRLKKNIEEIMNLLKLDAKYREKLLDKYTHILTRSEGRVDNVNHMIADLIKLQSACSERLSKEQDINMKLTELLAQKETRILFLEESLAKLYERYDNLQERCLHVSAKTNENNFHLK